MGALDEYCGTMRAIYKLFVGKIWGEEAVAIRALHLITSLYIINVDSGIAIGTNEIHFLVYKAFIAGDKREIPVAVRTLHFTTSLL